MQNFLKAIKKNIFIRLRKKKRRLSGYIINPIFKNISAYRHNNKCPLRINVQTLLPFYLAPPVLNRFGICMYFLEPIFDLALNNK